MTDDSLDAHAQLVGGLVLVNEMRANTANVRPAVLLCEQLETLTHRQLRDVAIAGMSAVVQLVEQHVADVDGDLDRRDVSEWIRQYGENIAQQRA